MYESTPIPIPPPPLFFFHIVLPGTEDIFLKNFSPITDQNFSSTN